jgi:hypothetical protein
LEYHIGSKKIEVLSFAITSDVSCCRNLKVIDLMVDRGKRLRSAIAGQGRQETVIIWGLVFI